ncbi:nucleoside-diphosphate-sugar epimerase [Geodermatophilus bullaregiensis]|uniref:NAD-dependent epimerase/dehydratase family protein n=1 Tax=Geodermatophilus bullaregiensis TaxID=1564160 RepID=UPI00195700C6|nr:NAD-dependent epimerase/dehydratase family protein [Geodermatophilus bullaregiensis]MBM7806281.1 nucleoside-diphosphate-sugar epimerase [Geodermatophilus bullaregiensis]
MGVGHARQAGRLDRRHREQGLDVVRLSPGFVYGPGGLFASAFVEQARAGRLRCIGRGANWWSCVHVEDLAAAYLAALTRAPAGTAFAVVDDEPLRLRELTDPTTDALGRPRVGTAPPTLVGLFLGRTLVASLATSFRISSARIRDQLGWIPTRPRFRDEVAATVAAIA